MVLDVATGTGPVAVSEKDIVGPEGLVVGLDRSLNMLRENRKLVGIPLVHSDAGRIPFPDNTFDFISMGYALRHVDDLRLTFQEYLRVLKPGGAVLLLELTRPQTRLGTMLAKLYLGRIVPWIAKISTGTNESEVLMRYFWDTIYKCVPPEDIIDAMKSVGFQNVYRHRSLSIFSEYIAFKLDA